MLTKLATWLVTLAWLALSVVLLFLGDTTTAADKVYGLVGAVMAGVWGNKAAGRD